MKTLAPLYFLKGHKGKMRDQVYICPNKYGAPYRLCPYLDSFSIRLPLDLNLSRYLSLIGETSTESGVLVPYWNHPGSMRIKEPEKEGKSIHLFV